eukprot:2536792-Rhodomonas_salina.1
MPRKQARSASRVGSAITRAPHPPAPTTNTKKYKKKHQLTKEKTKHIDTLTTPGPRPPAATERAAHLNTDAERIMSAAENSDVEALKHVLLHGGSIRDARREDGTSALHIAVAKGDEAVTVWLVESAGCE